MYSCGEVVVLTGIFLINLTQLQKPLTIGRVAGALLTYLIFISVIRTVFMIWCICILYRQALHVILKYKYGSKYKGLVSGGDGVHVADKKNTINCLFMAKNLKNRPAEEIVRIHQEITWRLRHIPKFQTSLHSFGGYWYRKQEDVQIDDYVKFLPKMHKVVGKNELLGLINDQYNRAEIIGSWLPWEICIGTEPVNWANDGFEYYPVFFSVHHAITDGVTLIKIVLGILRNQNVDDVVVEPKEPDYFKRVTNFDSVFEELRRVATFLWVLLTFPISLYTSFILNILYSKFLPRVSQSKLKLLTCGTDESGEYFAKVKSIKKKASTTFPEVLFAAYTASLADFAQKSNANSPEYVTTIFPVQPGATELRGMEPRHVNLKTLKITNGFSVVTIKAPVTQSLRKIIDFVREETKLNKQLSSYQINYVMLVHVLPYFPVSFIKLFIKVFCRGSVVSIIPGPKQLTIKKDSLLGSHCIAWVPQMNQLGTTLVINTYDNRLQIGFSADRAIVPEESDAKAIVDGIYKYLDLFEKEIEESK